MNNRVKTPTIFQMEATECGAASLAMIFAYFGYYMPLEQMRIETGVSRDGCSAANIMRAAKRFGLDCHGYRKEVKDLYKIKTPCIIHWGFEHFVVFEGIKGDKAYINDPAIGKRKLSINELNDYFTGIVLTFEKTSAFPKQKKPSTLFQFMYRHLKGQGNIVFKILYIGILLVFPGLVLPVFGQVFVDDILLGGYTDWLTKIIVFMLCCLIFRFALSYYRSILLQKLKSKMTLVSGKAFLLHMFHLPISFFDQRSPGDLVMRLQNNSTVNDFLAGELAETFLNVIVAFFYIFILLFYSPELTAIGLAQIAISITVILISNKVITETSLKMQISYSKLFNSVCSNLRIIDTIKASGFEYESSNKVLGYHANSVESEQKLSRFQRIAGAIPSGIGTISSALILIFGGVLVIQGNLTMGMLVAFNTLFDSFCQPTNALVGFIQNIHELKSNIARVEDIEKYSEASQYTIQNDNEHCSSKLNGEITVSGVSFGYSKLKPPFVENISFELHSGESIAIVGKSGCGKSTISKLISGLYVPWEGAVQIDNIDLNSIPRDVINASIATVSQKISLFAGSIKDNITMWNSAILEDDVIAAAKDACIHDRITMLPGGYQYKINENASNLSGGEIQRIEIARALATRPSILVMDEATSALDSIVEKQILDNIRARGCTCIIVAHRASAIRDCNKIIVMQNGKILQIGSHRSLLSECDYYRSIILNN